MINLEDSRIRCPRCDCSDVNEEYMEYEEDIGYFMEVSCKECGLIWSEFHD